MDVADHMIDQVSGGISSKELRRRGHPFGRRKNRVTTPMYGRGMVKQGHRVHKTKVTTPTPLLPINRQKGTLAKSFRVIPEQGIGLQSFRMQFTARHAKFILNPKGTKKMVGRGYWPAIRRYWTSRNKKLIYQMRLRQLQIMYARA